MTLISQHTARMDNLFYFHPLQIPIFSEDYPSNPNNSMEGNLEMVLYVYCKRMITLTVQTSDKPYHSTKTLHV